MTGVPALCYNGLMKRCSKCKTVKKHVSHNYCRECRAVYGRVWRKQNPIKTRAYAKAYCRNQRTKALQILGNKCVHCGNTDYRVLQIDHVDGGGTHERQVISTHGIHDRIVKGHIQGYQLLCANCNWIKKWERDENRQLSPLYISPERDGEDA